MRRSRKVLWAGLFLLLLSGGYWGLNSLTVRIWLSTLGKDCRAGVAVINGDESWVVGRKALPLMSVFKMFIALDVLENKGKEGELTVTENMIDRQTYSPMLRKYPQTPFNISIADLLKYAVSESDNNAADILADYAGGIHHVEAYVHGLGFSEIRLKANERKMHQDVMNQYLNQVTALDVIKLLKMSREDGRLSTENRGFFDALLTETVTGRDKIKKYLPPEVVVGHKTGSSDRLGNGVKVADNDAGFVRLADGREYYIAVLVSDSKMNDADNSELIARISKVVYDYFAD